VKIGGNDGKTGWEGDGMNGNGKVVGMEGLRRKNEKEVTVEEA
jgi:hypothetical protein